MIEHRAHDNGEYRYDCDGCNPNRRLCNEHDVWQEGYEAAVRDLIHDIEFGGRQVTPNPYPEPKAG